jgi:hypothetical protein
MSVMWRLSWTECYRKTQSELRFMLRLFRNECYVKTQLNWVLYEDSVELSVMLRLSKWVLYEDSVERSVTWRPNLNWELCVLWLWAGPSSRLVGYCDRWKRHPVTAYIYIIPPSPLILKIGLCGTTLWARKREHKMSPCTNLSIN